jgi:Rod binding domain-containing protein
MEPLALSRPGSAKAESAVAPDPKLVRAAHEFEAQMMQELLRPMTSGDGLTGGDDGSGMELGSGSGSGGALADFATEALGQALSERGGFGIADSIVRELSAIHPEQRSSGVTNKVTGDPHRNTVLKIYK